MTTLFSTAPLLRGLNGDSLRSPKVTIVNADAFAWLEQHDEMFDAIVVDFPDPTNFSIGKLYTRASTSWSSGTCRRAATRSCRRPRR